MVIASSERLRRRGSVPLSLVRAGAWFRVLVGLFGERWCLALGLAVSLF